MNREKREADLKIYVRPSIEEELRRLAERERRAVSAYCSHVLEEHVALKAFLAGERRGKAGDLSA